MPPPKVNLAFETHWCRRHLEPFRAGWPTGAGVAMVRLFELTIADERILAAVPKDAEGKGKTHSLDSVLREHSPLCCFVGDEKMKTIYDELGKRPPRGTRA